MTDDFTLGELKRRLDRLENVTVPKSELDIRYQHAQEWRDKHDDRHQWIVRLLGGTMLGVVVKIVGDWLANGGP